jgi:hypothetical protein
VNISHSHITSMADRVRRNGTEGIYLGPEFRQAVNDIWDDLKADRALREAAFEIRQAFKDDFPLTRKQAAE